MDAKNDRSCWQTYFNWFMCCKRDEKPKRNALHQPQQNKETCYYSDNVPYVYINNKSEPVIYLLWLYITIVMGYGLNEG